MQRFFPAYCLLVAAITFGYALYDPFQIDGDAVSYMDIGDLIRSHSWAGIVNGYWHPLYPACLALAHTIFHSTLANELHAYYMANFAIFLLQMAAIVCFTDAIAAFRPAGGFLLGRTELRYIGLALLVIASQRELSLGKVRPDALLQALLLFAMAALLTHLRTSLLRYAVLMGLALGFAYLAKSFAFLFGLICIAALVAFRLRWQKAPASRVFLSGAVALVCFAIVAGPYVTALSKQKGRFNFGESGALNYAWFVGGTEKMHLEPWQTDKFGSADVKLKHPEKQLMASPGIYSYAALPYGTYPAWFDTTYFNDQIKPKTAIKGEISRGSRNVVLVVRYVLNHPEPVVLLALLLAFGAGIAFAWRPGADAFWLVPLGLGVVIWAIYGTVNVEERYVTVGYLAIVLTLFAMLRNVRIQGRRRRDDPDLRHPGTGRVSPQARRDAPPGVRQTPGRRMDAPGDDRGGQGPHPARRQARRHDRLHRLARMPVRPVLGTCGRRPHPHRDLRPGWPRRRISGVDAEPHPGHRNRSAAGR